MKNIIPILIFIMTCGCGIRNSARNNRPSSSGELTRGSDIATRAGPTDTVLSDEGNARIAIGVYLIRDHIRLDTNTVVFVNLNDVERKVLAERLSGYQFLPMTDASLRTPPGDPRKVNLGFFAVEISNRHGRASVMAGKSVHYVVQIKKADDWQVEHVSEAILDN